MIGRPKGVVNVLAQDGAIRLVDVPGALLRYRIQRYTHRDVRGGWAWCTLTVHRSLARAHVKYGLQVSRP